MLLQKTSWRIKQFISHRKDASHENFVQDVHDESARDIKLSANNPKRLSWLSQTPSSETTTPLRRASSNATSRSLRLVIPENATAHSSASSLCSCDCRPDPDLNEDSLSEPLIPRSHSDIFYLAPSTKSSDLKRWQSIFSDPFAKTQASDFSKADSKNSSTSTVAAGSLLDLKEALGKIDPMDNDKSSTQSIRFRDQKEMPSVSDNVDQLIRETDEAFQTVGSALAEVKAVSHDWYDDEDAPIVRNFAVTRTPPRKPPRRPASPIKPSIGRNTSVTKTNAKKTTFIKRKTNLFGRTPHSMPPPPANTPSRWTLTEVTTNMADAFTSKMFRTEVEEMLTPGRIQKLREDKVENERPTSKDSSRSGETDGSTPTEPFHLESLSRRIGTDLSKQPPQDLFLLPDENLLLISRYPSRKTLQRKVKFTALSIPTQNDSNMTFDNVTFPSPPRTPRRPSRSVSTSTTAPLLPTIPEISPLSLPHLVRSPLPPPPTTPKVPKSYILLPSTPLTLLSPLYLHGSIRVERLKPLPTPTPARKGSSPLDWTAFQIAIAGTMEVENPHVYTKQPTEQSEEGEEAEIDDLITWFGGFGFEGYGMLVDEKMSFASQIQTQSSPQAPTPTQAAPPPPTHPANTLPIPTDPSTRKSSATSSSSSLPPSPMLDLHVPREGGEEEEVIPMGFNLGHDLGDFLRWEVGHVMQGSGED